MSNRPRTFQERKAQEAHRRALELQRNAKIAYEDALSQVEMISHRKFNPQDEQPAKNADIQLTHEIEELLDEAAQQGNIGGG